MEGLDSAFAAALHRWLVREISGDVTDNYQGQLRALYTAHDWDTVCRIKGIIFAYDQVLRMMEEIAQKMNEPRERPQYVMGRPN
jgi:hypothetical protein